MSAATPLLDFFKRGEVGRDERLLAASGGLAPRAGEQLAILIILAQDADAEVREAAAATLSRLPDDRLRATLARSDLPTGVREFFAARGVAPGPTPAGDEEPLIDDPSAAGFEEPPADRSPEAVRESITQQLSKMGFSERLKAAVKGSREMRAILVRDPNKMISASVLSSPKVTDQEVAGFARMTNVSEDVLRIIGTNRAWLKNYNVVVGLTKNPKTPLMMSLNLMNRLNDRDLNMLSVDRNVAEPLRVAARKKIVASTTRG